MRELQPGFGFNVSFLRFESRITTFTPSDPADPTAEPITEFQPSGDEIEVAGGVVFSFFDNALQVTYG